MTPGSASPPAAGQPSTPGLDVNAVTTWLSGLAVGVTPPLSFTRIGGGKSNLTYLLTDAYDHRWVLRRPPQGDLLASAHDVAREHRVLSALAKTSVPAPRPVALSTDPAVCDRPLLLMEHVHGTVVDGAAAIDSMPLARRQAVGLAMVSALGSIHAVDLPAAGLTELASHASYAQRQVTRWRRQWDAHGAARTDLVQALADRLARGAPRQDETTLVHGDYHLLNVITDPADGSVRAVLDWELCTLGEPLADLGCLLAYWPSPQDAAEASPQGLPPLYGFPTRDELVQTYAATTGRDVSHIDYWHALACWKIAVILQGVQRRAARHLASEQTATDTIDAMLERATTIADAGGLGR